MLLYVGGFSPLGLGGAFLLGALDADHQVVLRTGAENVRVVLHHRGNCAQHQHGPVARALTIFAQPTSPTDPDHVLQFSSATRATRESQLVVPPAKQSELVAVGVAEPVSVLAAKPIPFIPTPLPPAGGDGILLCLRSTLLLI